MQRRSRLDERAAIETLVRETRASCLLCRGIGGRCWCQHMAAQMLVERESKAKEQSGRCYQFHGDLVATDLRDKNCT